jgi:outer membrane protein insertion porin family
MQRIYQNFLFIVVLFFIGNTAVAQVVQDTTNPVSINPQLLEILNAKTPKEYTIAGITVTGNKGFDGNLLISISGLAVGDKVQLPGSDVFSKAITKLWKQNLIENVEIYFTQLEGKNLYVELAITERARLADYKFVGVPKGEFEELSKKTDLVKDRVVTDNMKMSAVASIDKYYSDKGFRNVKTDVTETKSPTTANSVILTFHINKGTKVKVNNITFSGNNSISGLVLKKQMKGTHEMSRLTLYPPKTVNPFGDTVKQLLFKDYLHDYGFLSVTQTGQILDPYFRFKLFSSAKYNPEKYAEDKDLVVDYYNSQGFRDAIINHDVKVPNADGNLDIYIKMKEGRKYYFGDMVWRGNTKYSDSILNIFLGIKKGDTYNLELLNKRLGKQMSAEGGDLGSLYMNDGYLFFKVDAIETSVYNDTINFEIRMQEGPQATIGKVEITGNDKTKDYVIRRELRTVPGEKFSREDIIRTQRELGQLGFFNPEKIVPNVVPNPDNGTVDIGWSVEEKSNDQLELSAGFGGGIGLTGTLGITFNNFSLDNIFNSKTWDPLPSGSGQKLSARFQSNGRAYRSANLSFTEPWLGGKKRNSFTVSLYHTRYANAYNAYGQYCKSCGDSSNLKNYGVTIALGKQLKWPDDYFSLVTALNVQRYYLTNYPNIFRGYSNGPSTNISLQITFGRNATQGNPIYPTGGSNFFISGQFTLPYYALGITKNLENSYELPEYQKYRFTGNYFVPIGTAGGADHDKQLVLKASAKFGYIGSYNPNMPVTPFNRFQLGDAGLSNNFAVLGYDIISQRGYPVYSNSNPKINPENLTPVEFFTIFNKYTLELRYPFSTSPTSTIYGLVFFEAANGWYSLNAYNPFELRRSIGVGMRFFLPMFGLLGFDYGLGIDRINNLQRTKSAFKFTFMLGQEPE